MNDSALFFSNSVGSVNQQAFFTEQEYLLLYNALG